MPSCAWFQTRSKMLPRTVTEQAALSSKAFLTPFVPSPRHARPSCKVVLDQDIGRDQIRNRGIRSAEHDVDAAGLQPVVADRDPPRRVPAGNRLGLLAVTPDVREVGILDEDIRRVQRDAPLLSDVPPRMMMRSSSMWCGTCSRVICDVA